MSTSMSITVLFRPDPKPEPYRTDVRLASFIIIGTHSNDKTTKNSKQNEQQYVVEFVAIRPCLHQLT